MDSAILASDHRLLSVRGEDHLNLLRSAADLQLCCVDIVRIERFGDVEIVRGNVVQSLGLR